MTVPESPIDPPATAEQTPMFEDRKETVHETVEAMTRGILDSVWGQVSWTANRPRSVIHKAFLDRGSNTVDQIVIEFTNDETISVEVRVG